TGIDRRRPSRFFCYSTENAKATGRRDKSLGSCSEPTAVGSGGGAPPPAREARPQAARTVPSAGLRRQLAALVDAAARRAPGFEPLEAIRDGQVHDRDEQQ